MPFPDVHTPGPQSFQGKNILVISPKFFGYEGRIVEHLSSQGAHVTFLDERPGNSPWVKVLIRINSIFIKPTIYKYYADALIRLKGIKFDFVLIISPECCNSQIVNKIKEQYPGTKLILYMWDSFRNKRPCKEADVPAFLGLFDRCLSFDEDDSKRYSMVFRPLFFVDQGRRGPATPIEYAFSFIGTIHSDRYRILKLICEQMDAQGLRYFTYPFLASRAHYWWYRLTKPEFRGTRAAEFFYQPLSYQEVMRVFGASTAILDVEHPEQRGLTMRTLEVIGAGKKLITTNATIKDYPFYDPSRVSLIARGNPEIAKAFINNPAGAAPTSVIDPYEIHGWANEVFDHQPG